MASLKELRLRIRGVRGTRKVTKATELVAATKMRRAHDRVINARPYANEISAVVTDLMRRTSDYRHPYIEQREVKRRLLLLVTSDRGLAGALNSNNVRCALREINEAGVPTAVVTIGRKGRDVMRRLRKELIADQSNLGDRPTMKDILPAIRVALDQYDRGDADQIDIVFAHFKSPSRQQATVRRIVPVVFPETSEAPTADFLYEPNAQAVLDALLPRYVESQIYQAVLENAASEQAARMIAMRNASDNASDLIDDLSLTANKVRQSMITTELMEIVGGTAALQA